MICGSCGAANPAGAKFCLECGTPVSTACPRCGTAAVPGAKFCGECGERLTPTSAGPDLAATRIPGARPPGSADRGAANGGPLPVGAERRIVTVLFADLVGFTSLAEGRDAERVRDLLSRYFETASEIVARYGGTIEKFIGDAVMAVWGAPTAHEDDAERAVRAALDLVGSIGALGDELGAELSGRVGVLTGEAAVTIGATNQGLVAGDLVNTASRLQAVAPPGSVLVGEATRHAAGGSITFEPAGDAVLKGKAAPVPAFRALRVVAKSRGVGRSDSIEPPFVGRDVEFRLVRSAYHSVARERRARLVSITGEAGMGKSRLAWEFSKYTDGLAEKMWWHEGRSPSYGEGISFWALSEMIRKRAGLLEGDDEPTTRERIAAALVQHVPDADERAFIEPCLLTLLGVGAPPPGGRDRLFTGWRQFFERLASESPVVLVFEDLQWADDGLLDFIETLLEWSQSYPLFVLTLARPELLERRPAWGAGRNATSLPLGPLSDEAMRELLAGVVPQLPEASARTILARAGGIPLYAVETLRMLVASGRLENAEDGTLRAIGPLDVIDVPPSLQALIAARLDGLPAADRSLLQDAAVLGQTFATAALSALVGDGPDVLEPRLRGLVARDLLSLDTDPRSPERGQYGFVQSLIREVAYGTLAKRDRRTRHLAAARYFEALGDEELSGALATHYLAAYEAAADGPEADALAAQARIALRAAAERAANLGSPKQALAYFVAAADLPGDDADQLDLLERAGLVAEESGQHHRAADLFDQVVQQRRRAGDRLGAARATAARAEALMSNDVAAAQDLAESALTEYADLPEDRSEVLGLRYAVARCLLRSGRNADAAALLEGMLRAVEMTGDESFVLRVLATRGATLPAVGRSVEGAIILDGVIRRAERAGLFEIQDRARINLSVTLADDDVVAGRDVAASGFEDAVRRGAAGSAAYYAMNAAEYDLHIGEWDAASTRVREVLELGLEANDRLANLAQLYVIGLLRGSPDPALIDEIRRSAHDAPQIADVELWDAFGRGDATGAIGHGLPFAAADDLNAPFAYFRVGVAAAVARDVTNATIALTSMSGNLRTGRWNEGILETLQAIAAGLAGDRVRAVERGRAALDMFRSMSVRLDEGLAALGIAAALGPDDPETPAFADEARRTLTDVGAAGLLEMYRPIVAPRPGRTVVERAGSTIGVTES
ncbi:MAG TPA: adenylate/guanylate cyclase domain-containing protein [Candidatus Limnocylindrales bacterium]|nr:adenylate/guanylate cyclase domain-containing protein [Candidatus Limnocylindrales bacterium]